MHHLPDGKSVLPSERLPSLKRGLARAVISFCMLLLVIGHSMAQPGDTACGSYAARCAGRANSPLCALLQQRCGGSVGGTGSTRSSTGSKDGMSALDSPVEMPGCGQDQKLVMVPTCRCGSPSDAGSTGGDTSTCAFCTPEGVRMECQQAR
jgi:hypothetical protein